jgi:transposase
VVTACVITPEGKEVREFGTFTKGLLQLGDWLVERGVTHVAMESTGSYWKPVYNLLEDCFQLVLVNAQHLKAVPGRKTDVKDAEWIADLLRHGLLRGSFIPARPQRELRELVRYRRRLIQERARVVNSIQKVLEGANIKLSSVATDVVGKSGRAMLEALVRGTDDPKALAALARGRLRGKRDALEEALQGLVGAHQRLLLDSHLRHLDFLGGEIDRLSQEVEERLRPFEGLLQRWDTITGVGRRVAEEVLAETGDDMSRFPTADHLSSWAKLCPGLNQSAGKRKSGRSGHGNSWLRAALVEAAQAAAHSKDTYLSALYHRLAARRGGKRAAVAVAHAILVLMYELAVRNSTYVDLGGNYFDERAREATARRLTRRLQRLGYTVTKAA